MDMKKDAIVAIRVALLLTIASPFLGRVRYAFESPVPPVWIQLIFRFIMYFVIYFPLLCIVRIIKTKLKSRKNKK